MFHDLWALYQINEIEDWKSRAQQTALRIFLPSLTPLYLSGGSFR